MPFTDIDGVEIAYETRGEGPPVVFLHCWMGNRSLYFEQVARFSRDYRCISMDFPGHGESGPSEDYSVEYFGEVVAGLMRELGVERAVFVGHSMGGMVSLYLALEHPELVEGLVLLDTTSYLSGFLLQRWIATAVVLLGSVGCRISDQGFKAVKALAAAFGATALFCRPEAKVITGRECYRVDNYVMVKTIDSFRRFDVTGRLGEIDAPTLVVVGAADMLADLRHARRMTNGITGSQMVVIGHAGHMALIEKPDEVNSAMAAFLERIRPLRETGQEAAAR